MIQIEITEVEGKEWAVVMADSVTELRMLIDAFSLTDNMKISLARDVIVKYPWQGDITSLGIRCGGIR